MSCAATVCCAGCCCARASTLRSPDTSESAVSGGLPVRRLSVAGLLLLPVAYGAFLVWQELRFRQHFTAPPIADTSAPVAPLREALDATAVATVLGLVPQTHLRASTQNLTLQASFIARNGLSKALLADAQGSRLYVVGEHLPGGSTLRRVSADHVVLWNKGREERLMLQTGGDRFLQRLEAGTETPIPAIPTRFLRPMAGQSE
ncbi:hypothetical protein HX828_28960 [Pseudomonas yamanorum]|uniref:Type II secretion system protein GspC N-terminal domain-containing protein n=1 Tax=Pseudomonas yamanorum TaxID=515393 RepID=A0A7Y8K8P5_9PSED|nr:hypothetical protein [Pseudomonas yamanorum]